MGPRPLLVAAAVVAAGLGTTTGHAQQTVPFRGDIPIAPSGIPPLPLPDAPVSYDTAEGQRIRVTVLVRGLANPWSLAFLPDGAMLVTERPGRLRIVRKNILDPEPVTGLPAIAAAGLNGLLDVVLHPQFATNGAGLRVLRQARGGRNTPADHARGRAWAVERIRLWSRPRTSSPRAQA